MKNISNALKNHISQEVTTLASCILLKLRDGALIGFTSLDQDIEFEGVLYESCMGVDILGANTQNDLSNDDLDFTSVIDSPLMDEKELRAGRFDHAEVSAFLVNYEDLTQGRLMLRFGYLGEIKHSNGRFEGKVHGLGKKLDKVQGDLYSKICRAKFGDSKCGFDTSSVTFTGVVSAVESNKEFTDSTRAEDSGHFDNGVIKFISGANAGQSIEIKKSFAERVTLMMALPYDIAVGDSYEITQGCDRVFSTCVERYNNAINFRAEPHIPGTSAIVG